MKKIKPILIGVVIAVAVLAVAKNIIAQIAVENGVKIVTGLDLKMAGLDVSVLGTSIDVKGMKLHNPAGYKDPVMVDLPELYVDYAFQDILKGKMHLPEVRVQLQEFMVVRNEKGELNLDSLKAVQASKQEAEEKSAPPPAEEPQKKEKAKAPEIQVDRLTLKIGKVVYKDYSLGKEPLVREFPINLNEEYNNITDPNALVQLILLRIMLNTPIAALTNFDVTALKGSVADALASTQQAAFQAAEKAQVMIDQTAQQLIEKTPSNLKELQGATGALSDEAKNLSQNLMDKTGELKEKLKFSFGNSNS